MNWLTAEGGSRLMLVNKDIYFFFKKLFMSINVHICAYVYHTYSGAYWGQRRAPDPLKLELQVVVNYHVGAGN